MLDPSVALWVPVAIRVGDGDDVCVLLGGTICVVIGDSVRVIGGVAVRVRDAVRVAGGDAVKLIVRITVRVGGNHADGSGDGLCHAGGHCVAIGRGDCDDVGLDRGVNLGLGIDFARGVTNCVALAVRVDGCNCIGIRERQRIAFWLWSFVFVFFCRCNNVSGGKRFNDTVDLSSVNVVTVTDTF